MEKNNTLATVIGYFRGGGTLISIEPNMILNENGMTFNDIDDFQ